MHVKIPSHVNARYTHETMYNKKLLYPGKLDNTREAGCHFAR